MAIEVAVAVIVAVARPGVNNPDQRTVYASLLAIICQRINRPINTVLFFILIQQATTPRRKSLKCTFLKALGLKSSVKTIDVEVVNRAGQGLTCVNDDDAGEKAAFLREAFALLR